MPGTAALPKYHPDSPARRLRRAGESGHRRTRDLRPRHKCLGYGKENITRKLFFGQSSSSLALRALIAFAAATNMPAFGEAECRHVT